MGMTQGAVYDAVNAIGPKQHQPYLLKRRFGAKASTDAAVATAAYDVLSDARLGPHRRQRRSRAARRSCRRSPPNTQPRSMRSPMAPSRSRASPQGTQQPTPCSRRGRTTDGSARLSGCPIHGAGHWWPLLNAAGQPILDPTPWAGGVEPFLIQSSSQFRTAPPLALDSAAYAVELNEVKSSGQSHGAPPGRSDQTYVAKWWQSAPTRSWNEVARQLITRNDLNAADSARLLALQNLSGADASINCWNDKYY